MNMNRPDYLIVGGGSAGATLASRLSEDPGTRVLLVEAGIDTPPDAVPADVADTFPSSSLNKSYFWSGLECTRSAGGATRPFPQARIMGGGSSVMGLWALRGVPSDFDAWTAAGAEGWGWSDVVRFYRRLEGDQDRDHSQMRPGPYKIRRTPVEEWPGFVTAIERAAAARGVRTVDDINENPVDGFFAIPLAQDDDGRASSARCYLTSEVRRRPNLVVMPQTRVTGLRFDGAKVVGVTAERGGESPRSVGARSHPLALARSTHPRCCCAPASGRPRSFSASASRRASTGAASGAISRTIPICILR